MKATVLTIIRAMPPTTPTWAPTSVCHIQHRVLMMEKNVDWKSRVSIKEYSKDLTLIQFQTLHILKAWNIDWKHRIHARIQKHVNIKIECSLRASILFSDVLYTSDSSFCWRFSLEQSKSKVALTLHIQSKLWRICHYPLPGHKNWLAGP